MAQPPPPYSPPVAQAGYPPAKAGEYGPGYPPQPSGYPPQQPAGYNLQQPGQGFPAQPGYPGTAVSHQTTTIVQQANPVIVGHGASYGDVPASVVCPNCHSTVVTAIRYEPGTLTWLACLGLCIVGCDLGCCFIPFCVDGMQDAVHICPACQRQLGVYRRM